MRKIIFALILIISCSAFAQRGWIQQQSGITNNLTYIQFLNANTGFACGNGGVFLNTTNGGTNWINTQTNFGKLIMLQFLTPDTGFVSSDSGLYRTTNRGTAWTKIYGGYQYFHFVNFNTGYSIYTQCSKTTNGGLNWQNLGGVFAIGGNTDFVYLNDTCMFATGWEFALSMNVYNSRISKSSNGGNIWSVSYYSTVALSLQYVSGISFPNLNTGYGVSVEFTGNYFLTSTNSGNNWSKTQIPNQMYGVDFTTNSTGWLVGSGGNISYTTNSGVNFSSQSSGVTDNLRRVFMLNSSTGWIVGDGGKILSTTTGGDTTTYFSISGQVRYRDNNQSVSSGYVKAIHFDSITLAITTLDSAQIQSNGTYNLTHIPPHIGTDIMAFENDEDNLAFVPTYYPSTTNWQNATTLNLSTNLTNIDIQVYRINSTGGQFHIGGHVYKQTQNPLPGVDGAIVYAKIGSEFKGYSLANSSGAYRIDSLSSGNYTLLADRIGYNEISRDVMLTNFSKDSIDIIIDNYVIGVTSEGSVIPKNCWLGNSYPNPFNPSVKIKFGLPKSSHTKIIIYDLLGREVTELVNEQLSAGNYYINWNANEFSSGVYFYRIEADQFTQTKKMVLLK